MCVCMLVRVGEHLFMSVLITMMSTLTSERPSSDQRWRKHTHNPKRIQRFPQPLTHTHTHTHTHTYAWTCTHTTSCTFQAADPPKAGVGECPRVFLILVVGVLLGWVGRAVADEGAGIQPVVCTDSHCHQGKGRKRPHGSQQHLDAPLTPHHRWAGKETNIWQEHRHQNYTSEVRTSAHDNALVQTMPSNRRWLELVSSFNDSRLVLYSFLQSVIIIKVSA